MKKFCCLFSILFLNVNAWAAETTNYIGPTSLSDVQLSDIIITGPANLVNVTLSFAKIVGTLQFEKLTVDNEINIIGPVDGALGKFNNLIVTGSLSIEDTEINSLKVVGPTRLENVKIKNSANIVGYFEAKKSTLHNITITSDDAKLSHTTVNNILVEKNSHKFNSPRTQTLKIENGTIINGNITFESKLGKILTSKDSKINGKIIGAAIHNLE